MNSLREQSTLTTTRRRTSCETRVNRIKKRNGKWKRTYIHMYTFIFIPTRQKGIIGYRILLLISVEQELMILYLSKRYAHWT